MTDTLYTRLKELRLESGLTQGQVSQRIGISQPSVCAHESGKSEPSLETLSSLSRLYHCTTDYILGLSNIRNNLTIDLSGLSQEDVCHIIYIVNRMKQSR